MGGFGGGQNATEGTSVNVSERAQRLNEGTQRLGLASTLDQTALFNDLVGGQGFQQGSLPGLGVEGNFARRPNSPAFNIINRGLIEEQDLSFDRQRIAADLLDQTRQNIPQANQFNLNSLQQAGVALGNESNLLQQQLGTFEASQGLNAQTTQDLQQFFANGGAPSQAQQQQIGNIFDAQRGIAQSNQQQQFSDFVQTLQDQATTRGLRFGDTPIQDRGNRRLEEFLRVSANTEASLGGQQANALLNAPLQQAGLAAQTQGQSNNQLLNIINQFSTPVGRGFDVGNQLNAQNQFGLQFSPAAAASPALQNLSGLLGQGQFASNAPTFSPIPVAQTPTFGQSLGQGLAGAAGGAISGAAQGAAAGFFSHPDLKEDIEPASDQDNLQAVREMPVYTWRYKDEKHQHLGPMTTDMPDIVIDDDLPDRQGYVPMDMIGLLVSAVRALDYDIQLLKRLR